MDQEAYVTYTIAELLSSDELQRLLVGREIGWVDPMMGCAFRYKGKIEYAIGIVGALHVIMEDAGDFFIGEGTISVR